MKGDISENLKQNFKTTRLYINGRVVFLCPDGPFYTSGREKNKKTNEEKEDFFKTSSKRFQRRFHQGNQWSRLESLDLSESFSYHFIYLYFSIN